MQKRVDAVHNGNIGNFTAPVNGILTGRNDSDDRSSYRSMLKDVVERVERRLKALNLSASEASRRAGLGVDAIRNMQRGAKAEGGRHGVSSRTVTALAPVLQTTVGWLMDGAGDEEAAGRAHVPVVGYVGAGAQAVLFAQGQGPFDYVEAPDNATERTVAAEIRGDSLGAFFNEWLVFYDDRQEPVSDALIGHLCVVGLPDERVLVKKLQRSRNEGYYHLLSQTEEPIFDVPVMWAARVTMMRPR